VLFRSCCADSTVEVLLWRQAACLYTTVGLCCADSTVEVLLWRQAACLYTTVGLCCADSTVKAGYAWTCYVTVTPSFPRKKPAGGPFSTPHTEPPHSRPSALLAPYTRICRQSPTSLSAPPSRPGFPKGPQGHMPKLGTIFFGEIALFLSSFTLPLDQARRRIRKQ
jgi:hypothetical protein